MINNYGRTEIGLAGSVAAFVVNLIANYIFVLKMGLGITGTGYACVFSNLTMTLILLTCLYCTDMRKALVCPDKRVFEDSYEFLKISGPNILMLCLDWWVFEFMSVIPGWIGVKEQATMIILLNFVELTYMVAVGLQSSSCCIIG